MKKLLLTFATIALAVASAASNTFHVTLAEPAWVGATQLKPGEYKLQVEDGKAMFKVGKNVVEVPAKLQAGDHRYDNTAVRIDRAGDKPKLVEILVGGSNSKIVFGGSGTAAE
jgi:hypothetical protein